MKKWWEIPSTTTQQEISFLVKMVKELPSDAVIVELGTGVGGTACALGCFGHKVYSFDSYVESERYNRWLNSASGMSWTYEQACKNVAHMANVILFKSDSTNTALVKERVSLLWVDGGHDYEIVSNDLRAWLPKMMPAHIICGHDFDLIEVAKAVNEFFPKHFNIGRVWVMDSRNNQKLYL